MCPGYSLFLEGVQTGGSLWVIAGSAVEPLRFCPPWAGSLPWCPITSVLMSLSTSTILLASLFDGAVLCSCLLVLANTAKTVLMKGHGCSNFLFLTLIRLFLAGCKFWCWLNVLSLHYLSLKDVCCPCKDTWGKAWLWPAYFCLTSKPSPCTKLR